MRTITLISAVLLLAQISAAQNTFPSSGNVGIGTNSPATNLQVIGHAAATYDNNLSGFVQLWGDNAVIWKYGNNNSALRFGSATDLGAASWSEKMRISDGGNVGIGTANPTVKLHVSSSNDIQQIIESTIDSYANLTFKSNSKMWQIGKRPSFEGDAFQLYYHNGTGWQPAFMTVLPNGNTGIGTTNINDANYKLFVETGIRTRKVKVDQSNWADYVFAPSYRLPSLQEVEAFIKKHRHLPDVPSEEEVRKEGLNLGDNQAILLRKIEELTLYVITQNRRQEQQQDEIKKLQDENKELKIEIEKIKR